MALNRRQDGIFTTCGGRANRRAAPLLDVYKRQPLGDGRVPHISTTFFLGRCGKLAELDLDTSEIDRNSNSRRQRAVKFPTSPHKSVVRYGAPALVA